MSTTRFPIALHQQIRAQARLAPDAPALASFTPHTVRLSRGELDLRASRLAARLRAAGVAAEVRVGVCVERSCDLFVALLAVLKAGGVFVALDPRHPAARLDWLVQDAGLAHGIVDVAADAAMHARFAQCFTVGRDDLSGALLADEDAPVDPRAAAYMIYTSGSTGTPKAVVVEHGPLAVHCAALCTALPIGPTDRLLHFASVNFDVSIEAWLAPLSLGASVVISDPPPFTPATARALMEREGVTNTTLPPAYLREFAAESARCGVPSALRVLLFGGEAMSQDTFHEIRQVFPAIRLVNGYGPTEAVISPMLWPVDPGSVPALEQGSGHASLPIGWPIGPRIARIDETAQGDAGELLLGGVCLARGYHGRPALTAERFLPDPTGEPGARIYSTGDLARERADGSFDYLGRIDDQVQVRGVRVEPGEIAACLLTHPAVRDAGVLAEAAAGRTQLIACVTLTEELTDDALKAHLTARLPQAWLPHRFARFERLPYTLNGKLDKTALRLAVAALPLAAGADYVTPETAVERALAALWQGLLNDAAPIGRADRFFSRGGDSLGAMQMQAAVRIKWQVNLRLEGLFDDPSLAELALLIERSETEVDGAGLIPKAPRQADDAQFVDCPASFAQQRFWVLAQTRDAGAAYHIAVQWDIRGVLNATLLQRALDQLIARHEAWRTTLVENEDGIVMQRVHAQLPVRMAEVDLRSHDETQRATLAADLAQAHVTDAFDLSSGPLLRATLLILGDTAQRLLLTTHHAVSDGWSSRCAFQELTAAYAALASDHLVELPALPIQYADYALWQRNLLAAGEGERQRNYWRAALRDAPPPLALPLDRPRSAERDYRGGRLALRLSAATSATLRALARRHRTSPFTVLLAAFDAWLYRLTGSTDIVVAVPVAQRQRAQTAPLLGLFLNTLALRAHVAPGQSFETLLGAVRASALDGFEYQDVPFEQVLDAVKPPVRRGDEWLRVKFAQQFDLALNADLPGATAHMSAGPDLAARFDFALDFTDDAHGIELVAAYALDGIESATAQAWLESFAALVSDAVNDPTSTIAELDCADRAEYGAARLGRLLPSAFDSVLDMFAGHVSATPHRIALADADTQLTFAELDDASERIARALQQQGAGTEQPVAVCIERSVHFAVALLGILKAGAYAVLLDPAMPSERLAAAVDACQAQWILSASQARLTGQFGGARMLALDALMQMPLLANAAVRKNRPAPLQAAYLIYTSGSTGTPKGVVISHRALADYVQGMLDELAFSADASMAMVSTVAADLGHTTLFGALCSGRTLHLLPAQCAFDPDRFAEEIRSRDVGIVKIVPSHLHALLDARQPADVLPGHALITGGETLPWALVERIVALKPGCRVINHYGPTEATVGALTCDTSAPAQATLRARASVAEGVPLGLPLPNAQAYVLDAHGASVPPGAIGELYLGGPGVARGYLGRAAATAERFLPHPFADGQRLYRTGDRVRLRADRRLDFLGRVDDQVKIRGYRVEPGEISALLLTLDGVAQASTLAFEQDGRMRLASFVTARAAALLDQNALREKLAQRLPDYMVPALLMVLDVLPVTANGKVDRQALRALASAPVTAAATGDAPRGVIEETLAAVWKEVLKAESIGREDNFFELGGDSILVLQVIARSRKRGVRFTPKQLFDGPTIARLGQVAVSTDNLVVAAPAKPQAAKRDELLLLTPAQLRFFELDIPQRGHWNQAIQFDLQEPFDFDAFARAFESLLNHHDIFKQRFIQDSATGAWQITLAPQAYVNLPLATGAAHDEADALAQFNALQCQLDLAHGPLACAFAAMLPDGRSQLYLAIHHLIVDGVSWRILLEDLDAAYRAARERRSIRLTAGSVGAQDWAARLARAASEAGSPFAGETSYWTTLATAHEDLQLDHPQAAATNADAAVVVQVLDAELTRSALTDANAAYRTQMIELLIAALAQALSSQTGQPYCRVELEGHGREALFDDIDASRTLGWLTSHYPLAVTVEDQPAATLGAVKDSLRAVPHKGLGFGVLRHYGDAATRAALAAVQRPRVTFNYLGQFDAVRDAALVARFGGAGRERDPAGPLGNALAIHAYLDADGPRTLKVHWVYGSTQFERATIETLAQRFESALATLVNACTQRLAQRGGGATPGDYPLAHTAGLTQATLERLPFDLRTVEDMYPLSPMQQGILFHSLFAPEQSTYVNQLVATLSNPDVARLSAAFGAAVARHDILRTGFTAGEALPVQIVHRQAKMTVDLLDWRECGVEANAAFEDWLQQDRARSFDLSAPPLMRVTLIRFTEDEWRLVWTRHHLLLDGWSTARFFADVLRDYIEPPRPQPFAAPAKTRYRDFIAWLAVRDQDAERSFWLQRLAQLAQPTLVAEREADAGRPAEQRSWRAVFPAGAMTRMSETARRLKVTLNTLVQGAWALTLQRSCNQTSVAFGATVAGRPDTLADVDTVLGLFINTLPVIAAPLPGLSAAAWLHQLQSDNAAAAEYAQTPLYEIQRWAGQGALFDTLLVFENYPVDEAWQGRDERSLKMRDLRNIEATDFALTLVIEAGAGVDAALTIDYGYDATRISAARVAALHDVFTAAIEALINDPQAALGAMSLTGADQLAVLAGWNATAKDWPLAQQVPMHRQFERAALTTPTAVALEMLDAAGKCRQLSYAELEQRASQVAAALLAKGVQPDSAVALCIERSFDMVIALLGVLKAGAAYLPIDPDYPAERIAHLLNDAQPAVVITQPHLHERVQTAVTGPGVAILTVGELLQAKVAARLPIEVNVDQLAYLIYTSGSTGKPKGAGNSHRALANRIAWMQSAYQLQGDDVVLHKTPFGFDVSVWEFVWPLAIGARLAIAAPGDHRDPARLVAAIESHGVSTLHFVPSMLAAFLAYLDDFKAAARCASIQRIVASGEALPPELVARVAQLLPHARLYNLYGPTEAAIDVSHWTCGAEDIQAAAVPIGHPIANLQLHVLDLALHPVPPGGIGELYLGGTGLARGYLGRPGLTAERFVPDPFLPGARLYRSGDLARRRSDGALDYLGRSDTQIKLRGQRIEPGEIEALLRTITGVHDAVVIVRNEQLIGYVARGAGNALDQESLLAVLRAQLPAYMVPAQLIQLDALPVTPNGKCDRNALPAPQRQEKPVAVLQSDTERTLAAIWQRVLRIAAVDRDDDFFMLGGHSLLATQANAQANLHWQLMLPLRAMFEQRTLAGCAALIDQALAERSAGTGPDAASAIDALLAELEME
ncbi:amino acid adenylation domain-containing protein [Collimonas pratensis]|uniref:non-ribosomal peptide synthetase n=1 Tax=Collimonas pratensis TaxID=279113 RepID=UPI00143DE70C|nr:non-ribosomal peptide synthetase [Collimonas pratensis]NKI69295.1 amino acid adenylation domain-containing protein [Collimonas pratensis]